MLDKLIELCIGTQRDGGVRVRLSLLLFVNGRQIHEHFHSFMLMPGDDPAIARKNVESHLALAESANSIPGAPWGPIPDTEWSKVLAVLPHFHTTEKIKLRNIAVS